MYIKDSQSQLLLSLINFIYSIVEYWSGIDGI